MPAINISLLHKKSRAAARLLARDWRKWSYRVQRAAFRGFPSIIPDPDFAKMLKEVTAIDEKENARSQLPADEHIGLRCIWVAELYTPAHIENLIRGFTALGWDAEREIIPSRDPRNWVQRFREAPYGTGSFSLGSIGRRSDGSPFTPNRAAPLPESVEYALGEVYALTSSMTCVVMAFIFTDDYASRYNKALRQTYATKAVRRGRRYQFRTPDSQKQEAITQVRSGARSVGADWFRTHLPGLFSSGLGGGVFPTCELLSLRQAQPFPSREKGNAIPEYLRFLDIDHDFEAWGHKKGFTFAWPMMRTDRDRFHAVVAFHESDLNPEDYRGYGTDKSGSTHYICRHVDGLISRWALFAMLSGFERKLSVIRDSSLLRPRSLGTMDVLRSLRRLISETVDIAAVSSELVRYSQNKRSFSYDIASFTPRNPNLYRDENITLSDALRKRIEERAAWLGNTNHSIRDLFVQHSAVVGTHESIKLQRYVIILSVLALIISAIAIWVSGENSQRLQEVLDWFQGIFSRFQ